MVTLKININRREHFTATHTHLVCGRTVESVSCHLLWSAESKHSDRYIILNCAKCYKAQE